MLAGQAFNSKKVRDHFVSTFWLTVGENPSIAQLLRKLAAKINVDTKNMSPDEIKAALFTTLHRKKVLLLVDDVWDDGVPVLDALDVTTEGSGSKILVTTRHIKVLKKRNAVDESILRLGGLEDDDCWKLFCKHAFGGVDNIPCQLDQTVIKAVVGECKRLPLALKVIARALPGETLPKTWQRQLKKLREAQPLDDDQEHQLYGTLRLSYDSLQPRLQKCFIYFAAFPEDYSVDSQKLANLWAGEKSLLKAGDDVDDDFDPLEECFYLLIELIERSLIDLRWSEKSNPYRIKCRIHDVLRDFARYLIRRKEAPMDCLFHAGRDLREVPSNWLQGSTASEITHLSLYNNPLESLPNELNAPKLEILLLGQDRHHKSPVSPQLVISPEFLESFSSLKVLDLRCRRIESLPESVGSLKNLIYFNISHTELVKLPVGLQKLTKLEHLDLQHCPRVRPWRFDISHLKSLSTLLTNGCEHIWDPIPEHTFPERKICDSLESLCEIRSMCTLSISSAHHEQLPSQLVDSLSNIVNLSLRCSKLVCLPNLHKLQKLVNLDLNCCKSLRKLPVGFTKNGAFPNLQIFDLENCESLQEIHGIDDGAFPCLEWLRLKGCISLQHLPTEFTKCGSFPALKGLDLQNCQSLQEIPAIEDGAFPHLEQLWLGRCISLQHLPKQFTKCGNFPALKELDLNNCESLQEIPAIDDGAFQHLEWLHLEGCASLQLIPKEFTKFGNFLALKNYESLSQIPAIDDGAFPHLEWLPLEGCTSLEHLPKEFPRSGIFPALKELGFENFENLQEIPPKFLESFDGLCFTRIMINIHGHVKFWLNFGSPCMFSCFMSKP